MKNYTVNGIEYDWKTGAPAKNDKGYVTRSNQIAIAKDAFGSTGGTGALPADYGGRNGTEAKAFEEAAKHNKEK